MKYDTLITELKNLLPTTKSVLIALPTDPDLDKMAAALGLFLTLEASGKQVVVVCDTDVKVSSAHLFGVDHIQKNIPSTDGGNLTITLEGVAAANNTIPALEKLDWFAENNNLNLVFTVLPGQTFQPSRIVPHFQGGGYNLIFTIGAANLNALGNIYAQNSQIFSGSHIVNIDTQSANTNFGTTNVIDNIASSVSEVMVNLLGDMSMNIDADSASNFLTGTFAATENLTNQKATADTFMTVANCLKVGGKKPGVTNVGVDQPSQNSYDWSALMPKDPSASQAQPVGQVVEQTYVQAPPVPAVQAMNTNDYPFIVPPIVNQSTQTHVDLGDHTQPVTTSAKFNPAYSSPSPEERPSMEGVVSETVEPDWLTPKIFKGTSIG